MADVSEKKFEEMIECVLLAGGPDACRDGPAAVREPPPEWYVAGAPGGYRKRQPEEYDRSLCLIARDAIDFIYATQPREWERLKQHHGAEVKDKFLGRVAAEIERRGTLEVLRKGIHDSGCKFQLAYFRPASGLNPETQKLYLGNLFSVARQLKYSRRNENSLDLAIFLNGIPIFTAELKNPFTGQNVQHAIRQYQADRDPREPLFKFGRCLAHFAVDPDLVYVTTRLQAGATRFLPFNQGKFGGAGNPPALEGFSTSYLWERVWARDSVLNLIQHFIHMVEDEDRAPKLIFPRYHQLDAVRRLVNDARNRGTGEQYLIQHSAGSGKSNSIAWLAHQLSVLHHAGDQVVFDSVVVVTDRRVLDRQLQNTVRQFEQTLGVVENIDTTSRQLKEALESGKKIIVSTLQKFPVIADEMQALPGKRFALIIDEAHSSQSGESTKSLKAVLTAGSLEEAAEEEEGLEDDTEDRVVSEIRARGRQPNVSTFAFTATPKSKTLELFGVPLEDGRFEAFSLYSMRQAVEEGFILDVLENYTTYKTYWRLLKTIADDPRYDRKKAQYLLRSFVDLHPHAIDQKVAIMVEHFVQNVQHRIGGRAKAMIVTRSRLHAVRYRVAVDQYLKQQGHDFKALVAFSGTVTDGGKHYTEANMNGFPETRTAATFGQPEYRFLIVANKFQTGFDQPLLHTMYVDKKLGGVNAVQTLSRLNRVHPDKSETMVLDFANDADEIRMAFQPYYEKTILSEATDPNLLYDRQTRLEAYGVYSEAEVEAFAKVYFGRSPTPDKLYGLLAPVVERAQQLAEDELAEFRGHLTDYVRLYAFLSQVLTFQDPALEKLYVFARLLLRRLPLTRDHLPVEIQQSIDMETYRIRQTAAGPIELERGEGAVLPMGAKGGYVIPPEELEPLSQIIRELNERFGTDFSEEDRVFIQQLEERLAADPSLEASVRSNVPENARLTFDHVVTDRLQDMVETNFEFYKRVTDDPMFAKFLVDWLFGRYLNKVGAGAPADR